MRMWSGAEPKSVSPRLVIACAIRLRGKPSGSHVMKGSLDSPTPAACCPRPKLPEAMPYPLRSLKAFLSAGVIGGVGIVTALAALVAAKLRVMQLGAVGENDLVQPSSRVAVFGDIHPDGDHVARRQRSLAPSDQPQRLWRSRFDDHVHDLAVGVLG